MQREIADAYVRVSNVQGNEYQNNLGDTEGALISANKAVSSSEVLLKNDRSKDGADYVADDPFFSILQAGNIVFYDVNEPWEDEYSDYSDGDDEVWDDDEDDDDDDLDADLGFPVAFPEAAIQPLNSFTLPTIPPWLQETPEPATAPIPAIQDDTPRR